MPVAVHVNGEPHEASLALLQRTPRGGRGSAFEQSFADIEAGLREKGHHAKLDAEDDSTHPSVAAADKGLGASFLLYWLGWGADKSVKHVAMVGDGINDAAALSGARLPFTSHNSS